MTMTYPEGKYPQERFEKSLVRASTYLWWMTEMGLDNFQQSHHVVLVGRGGDINFLLAAHVPPSHIHAIDHAPRMNMARYKNLGVNVYSEDVLLAVSRLRGTAPVQTVNLDFCNKLRAETVGKVAAVASLLAHAKPYISVTLSASREDAPVGGYIEQKRALDPSAPAGHLRGRVLMQMLKEWPGPYLSHVVNYHYVGRGMSTSGNTVSRCMSVSLLTYPTTPTRQRAFELEGHELSKKNLAHGFKLCGLLSTAIGPMLNEPWQRVAGWFAAETSKNK